MKPGPTGEFPQGKLNPEDEGELAITVRIEDGNVRIDFGKPVAWLAMPPKMAIDLAGSLIRYAKRALGEGIYMDIQ